jgi:hypothetical protein
MGGRGGSGQKATTSAARAAAQRTNRNRSGLPVVIPCSVCKMSAAGLINRPASDRDTVLICASCCRVMAEALDAHLATIPADQLAEAKELTSEQEFARAVTDEMLWELQGDGSLTPATDNPTRGRAWGRDTRRAWGQP